MKTNLVLPNNFVELDNEEMMYVDGGRVSIGIRFTLGGFISSTLISTVVATATKFAFKKFSALGAAVGGPVGWAIGTLAGLTLGGSLRNSINQMFAAGRMVYGTNTLWLGSLRIPFMGTRDFVIDLGSFLGAAIGGGMGGSVNVPSGAGSLVPA